MSYNDSKKCISYGFPLKSSIFQQVYLSGTVALASERTGGATLRTEAAFSYPTGIDSDTGLVIEVPEDWTFTKGSLRVTATDGSTVLLEADNGDESTARLTLIDSTGEETTFDEPWSVWQDSLRFD